MLLPGAIYVIGFILGFVITCACLAFSICIMAATLEVSEKLIRKTKAYKIYVTGAKNAARWWFDHKKWAIVSLFMSFGLLMYAAAGPYLYFINFIMSK